MSIVLDGTSGLTSPAATLTTTPLPVTSGGTGVALTTAYGVLAGGTTTTGALQNIGAGTATQVLTSNGASALPTFQNASGGFPATTAMVFKQTAAPTGWTKVLTNNDSALRVVTGAAGTGGSVAFTTAFASKAVTGTNAASGAYTLATADIPAHTHSWVYPNRTLGTPGGAGPSVSGYGNATYNTSGGTPGGGSHSHPAAAFTGTAINLAVTYVDVIVATKD